MPYKLTFKGDRKEEVINDEQGRQLYSDWQNGALPDRVEVRSGLTVLANTIKSMEYIYAAQERYEHTKTELLNFERDKLAPFLNEAGELTFEKELRFIESEGYWRVVVLNEPIRSDSDVEVYLNDTLLEQFNQTREKLGQWKLMRGKRSYAKKMQHREYEASAHHTSPDARSED